MINQLLIMIIKLLIMIIKLLIMIIKLLIMIIFIVTNELISVLLVVKSNHIQYVTGPAKIGHICTSKLALSMFFELLLAITSKLIKLYH